MLLKVALFVYFFIRVMYNTMTFEEDLWKQLDEIEPEPSRQQNPTSVIMDIAASAGSPPVFNDMMMSYIKTHPEQKTQIVTELTKPSVKNTIADKIMKAQPSTPSVSNTDPLCDTWRRQPLINPSTKRPIQYKKGKYLELMRKCGDPQFTKEELANRQSPVVQQAPAVVINKTYTDPCDAWKANPLINPVTKRQIQYKKGKYLEYAKKCGEPGSTLQQQQPTYSKPLELVEEPKIEEIQDSEQIDIVDKQLGYIIQQLGLIRSGNPADETILSLIPIMENLYAIQLNQSYAKYFLTTPIAYQKFKENPNINPFTGRSVAQGTKKWQELERIFSVYTDSKVQDNSKLTEKQPQVEEIIPMTQVTEQPQVEEIIPMTQVTEQPQVEEIIPMTQVTEQPQVEEQPNLEELGEQSRLDEFTKPSFDSFLEMIEKSQRSAEEPQQSAVEIVEEIIPTEQEPEQEKVEQATIDRLTGDMEELYNQLSVTEIKDNKQGSQSALDDFDLDAALADLK
jgi:hypothetical protein